MYRKPKYYLEVCMKTGYGHYEVGVLYYGKVITCTTTDMPSIDDYKSEDGEKDGRELRRKRGYNCLRNQCIRAHKNSLITNH